MNFFLCLLLGLVPAMGDRPTDPKEKRKAEHRSLLVEYFAEKASGKPVRWEYYASRYMREVDQDATDAIGFDSLFCLVTLDEAATCPEFPKAMNLLIKHHSQDSGIVALSRFMVSPAYFASASESVEALFRKAIETNPDRNQQAEMCCNLAQFLRNKALLARQLQSPKGVMLSRRVEALWGRAYRDSLLNIDHIQLDKAAYLLWEQARNKVPDFVQKHLTYGRHAPEIQGETVDGRAMKLSDFQGSVVVLTFWGFGCPPCVALHPHERELVARLKGNAFVLLGVNNDLNRDEVRKRIEREKIPWSSWWDGGDMDNRIAQAWSVRSWPSVYVLDGEGLIRYRDVHGPALDIVVDSLLLERAT